MEVLSAVYVRMNILLEEMGGVAYNLLKEISSLRERMSKLHVSWEGEEFNVYHRVLMDDLYIMEAAAMDAMFMHRLLAEALTGYQQMELKVSETVGGLK